MASVVAVTAVLLVSLLLPKKYTASASILIEPPAGNDPRGSTAVSPVYLESLKTYEHFALSDSLFKEAIDSLQVRAQFAGLAMETVKRKILQVTKPRDTKILEVRVTLNNPEKARDLARFIAQRTVRMNHSLGRASVAELTEGGEGVLAQARQTLDSAIAARASALKASPVAGLEVEVASASELKSYVLHQLSSAQTELAAYESRTDGGKQGPAYMDAETAKEAVTAARAQVTSLREQLARLNAELATKLNVLEQRKHDRDLLDKEVLVAQQQFETAVNHRNEILESVAFRGERLEIIDAGVIPEKPSFPNIPLNAGIAGVISLAGSVGFLAACFAQRRRSSLLRLAKGS